MAIINGTEDDDFIRMEVGGTDTVNGGEGHDGVTYENAIGSMTIDLAKGFAIDASGIRDTLNSIEGGHGGNFADTVTMSNKGGHIFAHGGDDTIRAGKNGSYINGGSGSDTIIGAAGGDWVTYFDGNLAGGYNTDSGGYITRGAVVDLGAGTATDGWGGTDTLSSIESVEGSQFADTIKGNSGYNALEGREGTDTLYGMGGNDKLTGGKGADKLYGGDGAKGMGADIFVFTALSDSKASGKGRDTIFDFGSDDKIDLSVIDANTKSQGDQTFTFIDTAKFSGQAGELRFEKWKSDTYVYADVNGDKKADFGIHLDDAVKLVKADFLL